MSNYNEELQYFEYVRTQLTSTIEYLYSMEGQDYARQFLADFRRIDKQYIDAARLIYIEDKNVVRNNVEESLLDILGFTYNDDNIFRERFIIPVYDMQNRVAGMVGYDADSDIKYLFSGTTYFDKTNLLYNMQNIWEIYQQDYVIMVEGFFDSIRLNSLGLICNVALMGTMLFDYQKTMLNRVGLKIIMPDNDKSGLNAVRYWKQQEGKIAYIRIKNPETKDLDAVIKSNPSRAEEFVKLVNRIRNEAEHPFFTSKDYWF